VQEGVSTGIMFYISTSKALLTCTYKTVIIFFFDLLPLQTECNYSTCRLLAASQTKNIVMLSETQKANYYGVEPVHTSVLSYSNPVFLGMCYIWRHKIYCCVMSSNSHRGNQTTVQCRVFCCSCKNKH